MNGVSAPESALRLGRGRQALLEDLAAGRIGDGFVTALSDLVDAYFRERLAERPQAGETPFVVAAVGGYGRRELCPGSDLDVLLLCGGEPPEEAAELSRFLFHPLWDLGFEVGHGVRGVAECLSLAREDFQVFASFVDLRFLCGDAGVFAALSERLAKELFLPGAGEFLARLAENNQTRRAKYGDAGAVLEPQLKEGPGGLRDVHQVLWLMRLAEVEGRQAGRDDPLFVREWNELRRDARFLLTVRCHLHRICGRKNDRLHFELQEKTAAAMGFAAGSASLPVEAFLASLLKRMSAVRSLRDALWPALARSLGLIPDQEPEIVGDGLLRTAEGLGFASGLGLWERRERLMDLFARCASLGVPLTHEARRQARQAAGLSETDPDGPRGPGDSPGAAEAAAARPFGRQDFEALLDILMADRAGLAGEALLETGVLGAVVPEFVRVADLVRFDVYHVHPVGRHVIESLGRLREMAGPEEPRREIFAGLPHPRRLFLGALFHDVGKGLGGGHSEKGARIAEEVLTRFCLDEEEIADVVFLVRRHLCLAETAGGRDLADREVLAHFATLCGTVERLDMLFLLTVADSKATGPLAWTSWKESLAAELHRKVRALIEAGRLFDEHDARRMLQTRDKVRALCRGTFAAEVIEARLDAMPPRYLATVSPADIVRHLGMLTELEEALAEDRRMVPGGRAGRGVAVFDAVPAPGGGYLATLAAKDAPRLFVTVAGVMALHDVNIVSADVFVWDDGTAVYVLRTDDPPDALYPGETWARARRAVKYAQTGKLSLDYRVAQKRQSLFAGRNGPGRAAPPEVTVDNEGAELFTLIEVAADDRIGLLYDIALTLRELDLPIHLARISTLGDRVRDVFYVCDGSGAKIRDRERLAEIRAALAHRLKSEPVRGG